MKKLSKKAKQNLELTIIIAIGVLSILLWNTPVIYPIKLFVVLLHEISHGIAAILTGGAISEIIVSYNLGGLCKTYSGNEIVIASAGYLGSLVFGVWMFMSAYNYNHSRWLCNGLAIMFVIVTIAFISNILGILFAVIFTLVLFLSPRYFNKTAHVYVMKGLGFVSCLYVLVDIKEDLLTLENRVTDAHILAQITGVSHLVWGLTWFVITLVTVYFLLKFSYKKGM
ncbi:MAG: M50 family metallopeptidase [Melioribacteraceae bacterium]|nr:M50 family metallopeptidase [Melioribacteraceae bacterium]